MMVESNSRGVQVSGRDRVQAGGSAEELSQQSKKLIILDLPVEIVDTIFRWLDKGNLRSLRLASKRYNDLVTPYLFRRMRLGISAADSYYYCYRNSKWLIGYGKSGYCGCGCVLPSKRTRLAEAVRCKLGLKPQYSRASKRESLMPSLNPISDPVRSMIEHHLLELLPLCYHLTFNVFTSPEQQAISGPLEGEMLDFVRNVFPRIVSAATSLRTIWIEADTSARLFKILLPDFFAELFQICGQDLYDRDVPIHIRLEDMSYALPRNLDIVLKIIRNISGIAYLEIYKYFSDRGHVGRPGANQVDLRYALAALVRRSPKIEALEESRMQFLPGAVVASRDKWCASLSCGTNTHRVLSYEKSERFCRCQDCNKIRFELGSRSGSAAT